MADKIEVFYHKKHVGTITRSQRSYYFEYSKEWLENGFSISPFSLPLKPGCFRSKDGYSMFGVFEDSMPDSWGRLLLDRYILQHNKTCDMDELMRLSYVDANGLGALEYVPSQGGETMNLFPDLDDFQKKANMILNEELVDVSELFKYAGSSGGSRPKAYVTIKNESWIIKFQSKFDRKDSGKIEYEYSQACKEIGIDIPEICLIQDKYFAIKRFDRNQKGKLHTVTAAGLLETDYRVPSSDYETLFKLTKILTDDNKHDIENLYLRMCFNGLAHNYDDHLKNFSYIYDEASKKYRLSPAYDMTYSTTSYGEHTTTINGKGKNFLDEDYIKAGIKAGIKKDKAILLLEQVKSVVHNRLKQYLE